MGRNNIQNVLMVEMPNEFGEPLGFEVLEFDNNEENNLQEQREA